MALSNSQIEKFQSLYKKRFGVDLTKEVACEKLAKLLRLMELVYKPITKEDYEKYSTQVQELPPKVS